MVLTPKLYCLVKPRAIQTLLIAKARTGLVIFPFSGGAATADNISIPVDLHTFLFLHKSGHISFLLICSYRPFQFEPFPFIIEGRKSSVFLKIK